MGYIFENELSVICLNEEHDGIEFDQDTLVIYDSTRVVRSQFYNWDYEVSLKLYLKKVQSETGFQLIKGIYSNGYKKLIIDSSEVNVFEINYFNEDSRIVSGIFDLHFATRDTNWYVVKDSLGDNIVDSSGNYVEDYNLYWHDKEHITDGRFDIKY